MKKILFHIVLIAIVGCKAQAISISNTEWKLVKMYGEDLSALNPPLTLTMDEAQKTVNGFGGCNRFSGGYELNQSTLKFGAKVQTRMFCQDKSAIEDKYFKALGEVQSFKTEGGRLFLLASSTVILEFNK